MSLRPEVRVPRYNIPSAHSSNPLWVPGEDRSPPAIGAKKSKLAPALPVDSRVDSENQTLFGKMKRAAAQPSDVAEGDEEEEEEVEEEEEAEDAEDEDVEMEGEENNEENDESQQQYTVMNDDQQVAQGVAPNSESKKEKFYHEICEQGKSWEEIERIENDLYVLEESVEGLKGSYKLVDQLGEGTFSSVYKAIDLKNSSYDNSAWASSSRPSSPCLSPQPLVLDESAYTKKGKVYVALKRIYVTSSPGRISNEIEIMEDLRGCANVTYIITAFRYQDSILVVMPHLQNDDFRYFYKAMPMTSMKSYFRDLFRALRSTHARGIIHRDVKPANFLFDASQNTGSLVDFGLAQRYVPPVDSYYAPCQHGAATLQHLHGTAPKKIDEDVQRAARKGAQRAKQPAERVGFPKEDYRPSVKYSRAGTRGFRAPEVLLKCPDQTVAIDIWSAGIILLSCLVKKFPIFTSSDDTEALMEISSIFGKARMDACAMLHNRVLMTNVPDVDQPGCSIRNAVLKANPNVHKYPVDKFFNRPPVPPTPEQAAEYSEGIDLALDFLTECLRLDPTKRITAADALKHPFLAREDFDEEIDAPRKPQEAVCGEYHMVGSDGIHFVHQKGTNLEAPLGYGIAFGNEPCPFHKGEVFP